MKKIIAYFGGEKKFYIVLAVLFIMWLGVMTLFYLKADEVTKSPCSVCAKQLNEDVTCHTFSMGGIVQRTFHPNFSITDVSTER